MTIVAFIIGMVIPTLIGWIGIRLLERGNVVLRSAERWALAHIAGVTFTMFLFFLAEVTGFLRFNLINFLLICTIALITLGMLWMRLKVLWNPEPMKRLTVPTMSKWMKIGLGALIVWTTVKIFSAAIILIGSPPYLDDVYNNWNMRGKMFYVTQELVLEEGAGGVSSYPPTVPLLKTWLATLAGQWHEGLVNAPHIVWYICALVLLFFFLRRHLSLLWAVAGTYVLSSLPLYLIHGAHAYADVFLSIHAFAAVSLLFNAVNTQSGAQRLVFLRLSGVFAALMVMTKNEALLMHLPVYLILFVFSVRWMRRKDMLTAKQSNGALLHTTALVACTLLPWLLFKWANGLAFGNAKPISGLGVDWQEGVAYAIWVNTFFEGNWLLLFPLLIGVLLYKWRSAFMSPIVLFVLYFLCLYGGQMPIYFLTGLSTEALNQTGYARGLIQLIPIAVVIVTMLAHSIWNSSSGQEENPLH